MTTKIYGVAAGIQRQLFNEYESITDYAGRLERLSIELNNIMPTVPGSHLTSFLEYEESINNHLRLARSEMLEGIRKMVKMVGWAKEELPTMRKYIGESAFVETKQRTPRLKRKPAVKRKRPTTPKTADYHGTTYTISSMPPKLCPKRIKNRTLKTEMLKLGKHGGTMFAVWVDRKTGKITGIQPLSKAKK